MYAATQQKHQGIMIQKSGVNAGGLRGCWHVMQQSSGEAQGADTASRCRSRRG